MMTFTASFS